MSRTQLWVDDEFFKRLNKIKARRILNGKKDTSWLKLTKEMVNLPSFNKLEEELLTKEEYLLKMDKKRINL